MVKYYGSFYLDIEVKSDLNLEKNEEEFFLVVLFLVFIGLEFYVEVREYVE